MINLSGLGLPWCPAGSCAPRLNDKPEWAVPVLLLLPIKQWVKRKGRNQPPMGPAVCMMPRCTAHLLPRVLVKDEKQHATVSPKPSTLGSMPCMSSAVAHWKSKQIGRWNTKRLVIEVLTYTSINFSQEAMKSVGERKKIIISESSTVSSMTCCIKWVFKGKIISLCNADILLSYLFYDKKALCYVNEYKFTTLKKENKETEVHGYRNFP